MKTLNLNLLTKWFDMTKSGVKTEDYREINAFWFKRLVFEHQKVLDFFGYSGFKNFGRKGFKKRSDIIVKGIFKKNKEMIAFNPFDINSVQLGYPKSGDRDRIVNYKHKGICIGEGNPEWGAEPGKEYFIIMHGEVLETKNINQ